MILRRMPKLESFERIRVRMLSSWIANSKDKATIIALTSRQPREGVSTVAAGLTRALGASFPGKVLVIDTVPGRRRINELLKTPFKPITLSELEGDTPPVLSDLITHHQDFDVDVLTLAEPNIGPMLPQQLNDLLERLRSIYRVILIDAGALSNDGTLGWLTSSDYRVLVIDANVSTREILDRQKQELEQAGITLHGSILNKRSYPVPRFLYWLTR